MINRERKHIREEIERDEWGRERETNKEQRRNGDVWRKKRKRDERRKEEKGKEEKR